MTTTTTPRELLSTIDEHDPSGRECALAGRVLAGHEEVRRSACQACLSDAAIVAEWQRTIALRSAFAPAGEPTPVN